MSYLQSGGIMNKVALNILVQGFLWTYIFFFISLVNTWKWDFQVTEQSYVFKKLLKNFQSDCTILFSHQQTLRIPVVPHFLQQLVYSIIFILTILGGVWYSLMVLICIFQIPPSNERTFSCTFCPFLCLFFAQYLLKSFAHFYLVICILLLSCKSFYILLMQALNEIYVL